MKLQDFRKSFITGSFGVGLLVASLALSSMVSFPKESESFSELWLLGPNHMAKDYPFHVSSGDSYDLFLGVGNHLGYSAYYLVCVKFRNQTQTLPNASNSEPSPLQSLYEFSFLLEHEDVWEVPIYFEILDTLFQNDSIVVERILFGEKIIQVDSSSIWDSENKGFFFQLFFELWLYNSNEESFQFHDRFVSVWLNMTG